MDYKDIKPRYANKQLEVAMKAPIKKEKPVLGNDFWGDLDIDAIEYQEDIKSAATGLIDYWGKSLTEKDLLKLKAYSSCGDTPIQCALARAALEYYLTQDYNPEFIHADMKSVKNKKSWWKFWTKE